MDITPSLARALCDRHTGLGADGVLAVQKATAGDAAFRMVVHNADGSVAESCGNGIRCLVWYAAREGGAEGHTRVQTGGGVVDAELSGPDARTARVRVDMGAPVVEARAREVILAGSALTGTSVSMGNPHFVVHAGADHPDAERLGRAANDDAAFPEGVNLGIATLREDGGVDLTVYERGAGLTLACGTGACAAAVALVVRGDRPADIPIPVYLPGGRLDIEVAADLSRVWMTGPATWVFDGEVDLERFEEAVA